MNYEAFKALVEEVGAERILALYFDNDRSEYYPDGDFNPDDIIEINGDLVIKAHRCIRSIGPKGGFINIPVTVYNTSLQAVITLDDVKDRSRMDIENLYHL